MGKRKHKVSKNIQSQKKKATSSKRGNSPAKKSRGIKGKTKDARQAKGSKKSRNATNKAPNGNAKPSKQTRKRDSKKYPGLEKTLFSKIKQEYFDLDYIESLTEKEKKWLAKFMEEYLGARLNGAGKAFHKNKKERKLCFDMNNARNRDITAIRRATGNLISIEDCIELDSMVVGSEDSVIELLDLKREQAKRLKSDS